MCARDRSALTFERVKDSAVIHGLTETCLFEKGENCVRVLLSPNSGVQREWRAIHDLRESDLLRRLDG
jgi:hypothetical protein